MAGLKSILKSVSPAAKPVTVKAGSGASVVRALYLIIWLALVSPKNTTSGFTIGAGGTTTGSSSSLPQLTNNILAATIANILVYTLLFIFFILYSFFTNTILKIKSIKNFKKSVQICLKNKQ